MSIRRELSVAELDGLYEPLGREITTGEATLPRTDAQSNGAALGGSQVLHLTFFTARKTATVNNITVYTGTTAAAATPTVCRMGIYSVSGTSITLVASTPNDTTLFASANTAYTKALSAPWSKVKNTRYALGILVVSGAAVPTFRGLVLGNDAGADQTIAALAPAMCGRVNSQADLPAGPVSHSGGTAASMFALFT